MIHGPRPSGQKTIRIDPFLPQHLPAIRVQDAQQPEIAGQELTIGHGVELAKSFAWSAMRGDTVVAAAGLVEQCSSHATAWALISGEIGVGELREVGEAIRRALACDAYLRVDTMVRSDFARGRSWALRLGFQREGTMRKWGPMAIDMDLYARIRGDG